MSTTTDEHTEMVSTLVKPGQEILDTLTAEKVNLWHAATGVVGEAGELIDAVKKHVVYNADFDLVNGVEEIGDIEFYLEQFRQAIGVDRDTPVVENMRKLARRYPGFSYTDARAAERADKTEA
jgi:NTP pyrophosphatase (non-canonical NTP hydrolase)